MNNQKSHPDAEYLEEWNAGTAEPSQTKTKRKTVFIRLHPKPNAPRHPALKPGKPKFGFY